MTRAGFSLIETVVAIAVTSLLVTSGYALFGTTAGVRDRVRIVASGSASAGHSRDVISGTLRGTVGRTGQVSDQFAGTDRTFGQFHDDEVEFTAERDDGALMYIARVRIRIDRERLPRLVVEHVGSAEPSEQLTVHGVSSLDIRYLDNARQRSWIDTWVSIERLPSAVELTLDGDALDPLLRFPILVRLQGSDQ